MADPFEVRMRFTSLLHHLNASTASALKAAHYALKHAEYADDLHSCILEQLERNNMNNRANIMYFLPALCDTARAKSKEGAAGGGEVYVRMIERDILRIVDAVAPDDGHGAANVKVVRRVLKGLEGKGYLQPQTVTELEECIQGRDSAHGLPSSPAGNHASGEAPADGNLHGAVRSTPRSTARDTLAHLPVQRLDKRQIEQRIEEDRERHKRAREGIWAIPQESTSLREDAEVEKMWAEVSDGDEDDLMLAQEEAEERARGLEFEEVT